MTRLEVEEFEDIKSGYRIRSVDDFPLSIILTNESMTCTCRFFFANNPYFTNDVLEKKFHLAPSGQPNAESSDINWKPGTPLAKRMSELSRRNQQNRNSSSANITSSSSSSQSSSTRSFFTWFGETGDPTCDDIAEVIKDDMWPNPLQYFLVPDLDGDGVAGEAMAEEEDEEDSEVDEEGIEAEEDLDDDDDEEDGEVVASAHGVRIGHAAAAAANVVVVEEEDEEEDLEGDEDDIEGEEFAEGDEDEDEV